MGDRSMDTTELATNWQREGYLEVVTRQVMPNVSKPPRPSLRTPVP